MRKTKLNLCSMFSISTFNEFIYLPTDCQSYKARARSYLHQLHCWSDAHKFSKTFWLADNFIKLLLAKISSAMS